MSKLKPNSQNTRILSALRANPFGLTAWQIITKCRTTNPRARISELKAAGYKIRNVAVKGHESFYKLEERRVKA